MLAGLRNAAKSKFAVPIIALLALSFAVWGVSDAFRGGSRDAVASVGPETVSITDYQRRFNQQIRMISQQTGETFTSQDAREAGLDQQVLQQMITGAALDAKAADLELGVSDSFLSEEIRSIPAFQDQIRGRFSRDAYLNSIAQLGMSPQEFERSIADDIMRQQMLEAVSGGETAPALMAENRRNYAAETRTADVLVLPRSLAGDIGEPSDDALQQIVDENEAAFTQPERRAVTVVWMDPTRMQQAMQIDQTELQELYEFRKDSLSKPGSRSFLQITAQDADAAQVIAERLTAGETPEAVAESYGAEVVTREVSTEAEVVEPAVGEAVFGMTPQDAPRAVEGRFGWTVIDVTAAEDAVTPSLAEVEQELRTELAGDRAQEMVYDALGLFEDARGAGASMEAAAREAGLVAMSYLPVDRRGYTENGLTFDELASASALMERAFSLQTGAVSDLIDLDDRGFAVVRVDRVVEERLESLDAVREAVESVWRSREIEERLSERAAAAAERARNGEPLSQIANGLEGAEVERVILRRGQTAGAAGPRLTASLFEAREGEVVTAASQNGGQAVAALREISIGQPAQPVQTDQLASEIGNDLSVQFQTALRSEYDVRTYPDQLGIALGDAPVSQ